MGEEPQCLDLHHSVKSYTTRRDTIPSATAMVEQLAFACPQTVSTSMPQCCGSGRVRPGLSRILDAICGRTGSSQIGSAGDAQRCFCCALELAKRQAADFKLTDYRQFRLVGGMTALVW